LGGGGGGGGGGAQGAGGGGGGYGERTSLPRLDDDGCSRSRPARSLERVPIGVGPGRVGRTVRRAARYTLQKLGSRGAIQPFVGLVIRPRRAQGNNPQVADMLFLRAEGAGEKSDSGPRRQSKTYGQSHTDTVYWRCLRRASAPIGNTDQLTMPAVKPRDDTTA